jgi:hypothetical protein
VQPPQVGADARRLRVTAFEHGVAVAVLCREPLTQLKLTPVVAISPGSTVRAKVRPPKSADKPDLPWFIAALDALGVAAIESVDPTMPPSRRVDALLERLDALPEHEGLHHALQQACVEAQAAADLAKAARSARKNANAAASAPTPQDSSENEDDVDEAEGGDGDGDEDSMPDVGDEGESPAQA